MHFLDRRHFVAGRLKCRKNGFQRKISFADTTKLKFLLNCCPPLALFEWTCLTGIPTQFAQLRGTQDL